jgi:redox-sensitive bicupin YhaK (pirin superfamily)
MSSILKEPSMSHTTTAPATRRIAHRTTGHRHGPVTRLMSPGDLGQRVKPFVFLDLFDSSGSAPGSFGLHPHSGIATLTFITHGAVSYEDTSGEKGVVAQGGVEWMMAGGGMWHGGGWSGDAGARGFQLWVALPPGLEQGEAASTYLAPASVPQSGPVRVLLGHYAGATSAIAAPSSMNYLAVRLKAGEHWSYSPPQGHTVAWAAIAEGELHAPSALKAGEMAVFEESNGAIDFHAAADAEFVIGSAVKHPHELVTGYYSVHTSAEALREGEERIRQLGDRLRLQGRLR